MGWPNWFDPNLVRSSCPGRGWARPRPDPSLSLTSPIRTHMTPFLSRDDHVSAASPPSPGCLRPTPAPPQAGSAPPPHALRNPLFDLISMAPVARPRPRLSRQSLPLHRPLLVNSGADDMVFRIPSAFPTSRLRSIRFSSRI
jgi:hypothetical protein